MRHSHPSMRCKCSGSTSRSSSPHFHCACTMSNHLAASYAACALPADRTAVPRTTQHTRTLRPHPRRVHRARVPPAAAPASRRLLHHRARLRLRPRGPKRVRGRPRRRHGAAARELDGSAKLGLRPLKTSGRAGPALHRRRGGLRRARRRRVCAGDRVGWRRLRRHDRHYQGCTLIKRAPTPCSPG